MKTMQKTLLITALLLAPLAAAQAAQQSASEHQAWIEAQKIDVQPTLTVKESQVPADSGTSQPSSYGTQAPSGMNPQMPATPANPNSGSYAPNAQPAPMQSHPGMQSGTGMKMQ